MSKNGRPSLINDIRLFAGDRFSYLKGQQEAVAHSHRIALFLNGEGFSLGAFPALYVFFTPALEPGEVRASDHHGDWWHRYVDVGVAAGFPDVPDTLDVVKRGIVDALLEMRREEADTIRRADTAARDHGERLRFLLKRRETKKLVIEISFNVCVWPGPSYLFIAHTDKLTGTYREADPIALGTYWEGFDLAGAIRLEDAINLKEKPCRPVLSGLVRPRG
jgi:hypothetical protein